MPNADDIPPTIGRNSRIAIFGLISKHSGRNRGGTSFSVARMASFFAAQGCKVDIVCGRSAADQNAFEHLPSGVRVLPVTSTSKLGLSLELFFYLRSAGPDALLSLDTRANQIACRMKRWRANVQRVYVSLRNTIENKQSSVTSRDKKQRLFRSFATEADGVIAISEGLASEFASFSGSPQSAVHVIHNLVVNDNVRAQIGQNTGHPWLERKQAPVILGVGRLEEQKDFPTLIRAFAELRATRDVKLIILGEGQALGQLEALGEQLGIIEHISFPGFVQNPVSYMSHADVFTLSSRYEGFGMVIAEALAAGCQVVSTDCPSGPREILRDGALGHLVQVGDSSALADGIRASLDNPLPADVLRTASEAFAEEVNGQKYLDLLLFGDCKDPASRN